MEDKVHGAFVGEKINKVRWKPEDLTESDIFLTGSWDNGVRDLLQNFQERDKIWNINCLILALLLYTRFFHVVPFNPLNMLSVFNSNSHCLIDFFNLT